uniref:At1g68980-like TPR repeats domain-containing protein n=1 Tax=Kalanchoe fedtschenkoi TaxID=63787 RepID=A0A7N0ULJ5_KALFE
MAHRVGIWRRAASYARVVVSTRPISSSSEIPTLYSFLRPSIFALHQPKLQPAENPPQPLRVSPPKALTQDQLSALESSLRLAVESGSGEDAWKAFKAITCGGAYPRSHLFDSLIRCLCSLGDKHSLKRAFAALVYVVERKGELVEAGSVRVVLESLSAAGSAAAAFALVRCVFRNRVFVPFGVWGDVLVDVSRKSGEVRAFLGVFEECCRVGLDEEIAFLMPDLNGCNAALDGCCRELESVEDAERVVELMALMNVRPDEVSFGCLGYLYALKGMQEKLNELEGLMGALGFSDPTFFISELISGYVKAGNLESASAAVLRSLRERSVEDSSFSDEIYAEVVNGFVKAKSVKGLATLIAEAQKLEPASIAAERSVGFGIVDACVNLGWLDKAHTILDEMNAQGASVGIGVYVSIVRAYCKQHRTAEAAQLVVDISSSGLQLDVGTYDTLIEESMAGQDFQSAFSVFRDMRESRTQDLKGSYLTIMTGLTENHRPELMAAFLDEVVSDPRIEVGTHDWNSIIHAFCKAGRLEDARRTFRRMVFLRFEPNEQTYLSLINGYTTAEKYFSVLMLWNELKRKLSSDVDKGVRFEQSLFDAFLYALVKGGFFDAVMQVVEKSQEMKIFVDKWRYKQAFMEAHKKLRVAKVRKRNFRKMEALIAFKNWAGLSS